MTSGMKGIWRQNRLEPTSRNIHQSNYVQPLYTSVFQSVQSADMLVWHILHNKTEHKPPPTLTFQPKVIPDSNPDCWINPNPDVCWLSPKMLGFIILSVLVILPSFVNDPESVSGTRAALKVNQYLWWVDPIITPSFNEIGSLLTDWQTDRQKEWSHNLRLVGGGNKQSILASVPTKTSETPHPISVADKRYRIAFCAANSSECDATAFSYCTNSNAK